eukprot:3058126-Amphidinium_carterae.1
MTYNQSHIHSCGVQFRIRNANVFGRFLAETLHVAADANYTMPPSVHAGALDPANVPRRKARAISNSLATTNKKLVTRTNLSLHTTVALKIPRVKYVI